MSKTREEFVNSLRFEVPNTPISTLDGTPNTSMPEEHDEPVQELGMVTDHTQEKDSESVESSEEIELGDELTPFLPDFEDYNQQDDENEQGNGEASFTLGFEDYDQENEDTNDQSIDMGEDACEVDGETTGESEQSAEAESAGEER